MRISYWSSDVCASDLKDSVYRVRTISNEQIRLRASISVENILNTQLGMRSSNDLTLGESDIQLMGMSGQNVKVLVDGIPLIDRGATKQSLSQVDVNHDRKNDRRGKSV